ncbi:hypothetical protein B0T26DRAFT_723514, partial [Lasiosphaeria miniovina]
DLSKGSSPSTRRKFQKAARAVDKLQMDLVLKKARIEALKAELERIKPKKRRKIPNPNKQFMDLGTILLGSQVDAEPEAEPQAEPEPDEMEEEEEDEDDDDDEVLPAK